MRPKGLVLSGGPSPVCMTRKPRGLETTIREEITRPRHLLWAAIMVTHLSGGHVGIGRRHREYGRAEVNTISDDGLNLFKGFGAGNSTVVWMRHGDRIGSGCRLDSRRSPTPRTHRWPP